MKLMKRKWSRKMSVMEIEEEFEKILYQRK